MATELNKQLVYAVDRSNEAAWSAMMKICQSSPRPGSIIPLDSDEFAALASGVIVIQMPSKDEAN